MDRRRGISLSLALTLVVAAAGCSAPTAVEEDGVEVQARSSEVVIRNHRTVPIFVLLLEREFAARANFAPCPRTGDCPRVEPGGRAALDRDRIGGVDPGSEEAVLAWWEVRPAADGGFEDTLMHSIVFPLR